MQAKHTRNSNGQPPPKAAPVNKAKIALTLTLTCVALTLLAMLLTILIGARGGPEALAMIVPLCFAGVLNLSLGPIALYHAYRHTPILPGLFVLAYYCAFNLFILLISNGQALLYPLTFAILTLIPFLYRALAFLLGRRDNDEK